MSQVLVCFDPSTQTVDFAEDANGFISLEGGLETASLYSTLSNRRAPADNDEVRDQPYGWWGDEFADVPTDLWGSLFWLILGRGKLTLADIRKSQVFIEDAHRWMVIDSVAKSVSVTVERLDNDGVRAVVNIVQPDGQPWNEIWEIHRNAVRGTL